MSTEWWTLLTPLVLVVGFLLFKRLGQVSPAEARRIVKEGGRLIDVRSPDEFAGGHLPGAVNVPVNVLSTRLERLGPKDQAKVVYCASGTRSALARSLLKRHGFIRVFDLGAMRRW